MELPTEQPLRALVTGASRGIGRAIALRLAQEGASLALCSRSENDLRAVGREVMRAGGKPLVCPLDVTDPDSVRVGVETALSGLGGGLDILVNNAGIFDVVPFEETTLEMWERFHKVNVRGAYLVTQHALPGLRASARAHVFNIASVAAQQGFAGSSIYCATKAGLMGLSNGLREDLRPEGIRVSTIYPGATDTSIFDGVQGDWDRTTMNPPEDVARVLWEGFESQGDVADLVVPPV